MVLEEHTLTRRQASQQPRNTEAAERRSGRGFRFPMRKHRSQTFSDFMDSFVSSDAHVIRCLLVGITVLTIVCLCLAGMTAWLLVYGVGGNGYYDNSNDDFSKINSEKYFDDNAVMDIWNLYEIASKTNDDYHKNSLREYLLKYKKIVDEKRETLSRGAGVTQVEIVDVDDGKGPILPKYTSSPDYKKKKNLESLIMSLRSIINKITLHDEKNGLHDAAVYVEESLHREGINKNTSSTGGGEDAKEEKEAYEPFDDILYFQLYYYYEKKNKANNNNNNNNNNVSGGDVFSEKEKDWWLHIKSNAPSVYNKRFYYPLRRYHRLHQFSPETSVTTSAWYNAMVDDYYENDNGDQSSLHFSPPRLPEMYTSSVLNAIGDSDAIGFPVNSTVYTGTLFVSIASFRDKECWPTISHMIRRSTNMFRVHWGVAQQNYAGDLPCVSSDGMDPFPCIQKPILSDTMINNNNNNIEFDGSICFPLDNVRVRRIRSFSAKGPTYGRYMAMLLYSGEDYTLIIDSHNRFVYAWDARIVGMFASLEHPKAVLSHYPESYDGTDENTFKWERTTTAYLCQAGFIESVGYLRLAGIIVHDIDAYSRNARFLKPFMLPQLQLSPDVVRPLPQPWVAGGFLFAASSIMREVPFDPHLPYLFDGEEIMYSVRLWTHGYDIFSPKRGICYHFYDRPQDPKLWNEAPRWYPVQTHTRRRIHYFMRTRVKGVNVLRVPKETEDAVAMMDADRYGTGRLRSVDAWYKFAGANPVLYKVDGRWCAKGS